LIKIGLFFALAFGFVGYQIVSVNRAIRAEQRERPPE
jgi:hypothetical protein